MSDLQIRVEVFAGTAIETACHNMARLASKSECTVVCNFNGVELMMFPGDDPAKLVEEYRKEIKSKSDYKVARGEGGSHD